MTKHKKTQTKTKGSFLKNEQELVAKGEKETAFDDDGTLNFIQEVEEVEIEQTELNKEETVSIKRLTKKIRSTGEIVDSALISSIFMRIHQGNTRKITYELPDNVLNDFNEVTKRMGISKRLCVALAMDLLVSLYDGYDFNIE